MALREKATVSGSFPSLWRGEAKMLPGGFNLVQDFPAGTILRIATPVQVFFDTMTAAVVKTAAAVSGGTATKPRVAKGHAFAVGDFVGKAGSMESSPKITAIDASNPDYDTITLSASLSLAEGDLIVEVEEIASDAAAGTKAVQKYTATHVLGATKEFKSIGHSSVDVAYDCIVLMPAKAPVPADWLTAAGCLKENHSIRYIKQ